MSAFVLKAADAVLRLEIDWRRGDLAAGETVLRDLGWSVLPASTAGPVIVSQSITPTGSQAEIAGGLPGRFHLVWCRVRTNRERVLCRCIVLRIAQVRRPN